MDSGDATQLIILFILLMLSAFFSSAETALTTVNKIRIRSLAEEGSKRAKTVLKITDDSGKMLSAILIGNNIVNLSAASLTTSLADRRYTFIRGDHAKNNGYYPCGKDVPPLCRHYQFFHNYCHACHFPDQRAVKRSSHAAPGRSERQE